MTTALAMGNKLGQPAHQNASYLIYAVGAAVTAGVVEEIVVLAFVVTTLRQAARPLPEIVLVAVLMRCSYHDYYGLGVLGIAIWATVFIWLFLRAGSIVPLVVVHIAWDANIFLGERWHVIPLASANVYLLLFVIAAITWLVDLRAGSLGRQGPPGGAPVVEPPVTGPQVTGPPITGSPLTGPSITGPAATGSSVTGPPVPDEPPLRLRASADASPPVTPR